MTYPFRLSQFSLALFKMKENTMNTLHKIALTLTSSLLLSVPAFADTSQWGEWDLKQNNQDTFFSSQTFSEADLILPEVAAIETFDSTSMMGTQLAGTPYQGLDTDPIELNEQGIPLDLLKVPTPISGDELELIASETPFDLDQNEVNAHEYN